MSDAWLWLGDASEARRKRRARLFDMRVDETSMVDAAANRRRFLVVKQEDGMKPKVDPNEFGSDAADGFDAAPNLITVDKDDDGSETEDFGSDPEESGNVDEKANEIPEPVKDAVMKALREAIERLMSIANAMRGADTAEAKSDKPLPAIFGRELRAVGTLLDGVTTTFPSPMAKADDECPPGFTFDREQGKCVRDEKVDAEKSKLDPAVKAAAERMLTAVIEDLTGVRKTVQDSEAGNSHLPEYIGQKIRAAAVALGAVLSAHPTATAKGFGLVDLEFEETALLKACQTLKLHPEQSKDLCEKVEKCIDAIAVLLGQVDAAKSRTLKADDVAPLPLSVAAPLDVIKADILDVAENYVAEEKEGEGEGTPAEETPAEGAPAEGTPAEGTPAEETPAESTEKVDCKCGAADAAAKIAAEKAAAEKAAADKAAHPADCPEGQHMVDGKCVPKTKEASASTPSAEDLVKMVTAAVTAAVDPLSKKIDDVIVKQHATEQRVEKMAGETPGSNVTPAGSTEPIAKRENENAWEHQIGRDPEEIKALKEADLLF